MVYTYDVGLFWSVTFILACKNMVIAGAVSHLYFSRFDTPRYPVLRSLGNLLRFHIGSVALGSFLISLLQWIRLIVAFVERKFVNQIDNKCAHFVVGCCQCCLWSFDHLFRYMTRNSYVMISKMIDTSKKT